MTARRVATFSVPVKLVSGLNAREHWRVRSARASAQRAATAQVLRYQRVVRPTMPCLVTLTRVAPRALDDDNLAASGKHVRDEIAKWFGVDDKPGSGLTWAYQQRRGGRGEYACEVQFEEVR